MPAGQMDLLWTSSLAAIPIAIAIGCLCRWIVRRPATRHALWVIALLSLTLPAVGVLAGAQRLDIVGWSRSAADRVTMLAGAMVAAPGQFARALAPVEPEPILTSPLPPPAVPIATSAPAAPTETPSLTTPAPRAATASAPASPQEPRPLSRPAGQTRSAPASRPDTSPIDLAPAPRKPAGAGRSFAVADPARAAPTPPPEMAAATIDSPRPTLDPAPEPGPDAPALDAPIDPAPATPDGAAPETMGATAPLLTPRRAISRGLGAEASAWLGRLADARNAILALPSPPVAIWLGGAGLVLGLGLLRLGAQGRRWRRSHPAPAPVRAQVAQVAGEIGLRRLPRCAMTDERISPMICCGVRPRLLLPAGLWHDLDADSRRAVLLHELAHLRRRDHLICWLEAAIGCLYWWHPVVWWARRRIREEADLSCDAWVVALMPSGRRAYAEALLSTRSYLSAGSGRSAGGLPMATARSRRFSRRLTMVMTAPARPGISRAGAMIAAAVALSGALIMPGVACPPEEKSKNKERAAVAVEAVRAARAAEAAMVASEAVDAVAEEATSFERFMGGRQPGASDSDARLRDLERRLQRMEELLQQMSRQGRGGSARGSGGSGAVVAPRAPAAPPHGAGGAAPQPPQPPQPPAPMHLFHVEPPHGAMDIPSPDMGEEMRIRYYLPDGKLSELTKLMVRSDVPVLVSPSDDYITVLGNLGTQRRFYSFVTLIHPEGVKAVDDESEEPVDSLSAGHAPHGATGGAVRMRSREAAQQLRERARQREMEIRSRVNESRQRARELQSRQRSLESQGRTSQRQGEAIDGQAERVSERAEALWEQLSQMQDGLCEADESKRAEALNRIAELEAQARDIEAEALELVRQAEQFELEAEVYMNQAEAIGDQVEAAEEDIDTLEEMISELEEELEEQIEQIETAQAEGAGSR